MSTTRHPRHRTSATPTVRPLRADRDRLAPPSASTTRRAAARLRRRPRWLPRMTRGRALALLALSLVILLGGTPAVNAAADCGITNIGGCITNAINAFFRGVVTDALNPLLDLLSKTLLTTPTPDSLPRVGELWDNSWQILLASYALLVLIAGILVM